MLNVEKIGVCFPKKLLKQLDYLRHNVNKWRVFAEIS